MNNVSQEKIGVDTKNKKIQYGRKKTMWWILVLIVAIVILYLGYNIYLDCYAPLKLDRGVLAMPFVPEYCFKIFNILGQ